MHGHWSHWEWKAKSNKEKEAQSNDSLVIRASEREKSNKEMEAVDNNKSLMGAPKKENQISIDGNQSNMEKEGGKNIKSVIRYLEKEV